MCNNRACSGACYGLPCTVARRGSTVALYGRPRVESYLGRPSSKEEFHGFGAVRGGAGAAF